MENQTKKEIFVVAGIIEYEDKILCMKRDVGKCKEASLKWEFPGGKIESGETKEQALKRELQEEMEMDVEIENHLCDVRYEYPEFIVNMYCFNCRALSKRFVMNVHVGSLWLKKEELNTIDWAPADRPVVEKVLA